MLCDKFNNYLNARTSYAKGRMGPVLLKDIANILLAEIAKDLQETLDSRPPPLKPEPHSNAWKKSGAGLADGTPAFAPGFLGPKTAIPIADDVQNTKVKAKKRAKKQREKKPKINEDARARFMGRKK